jgi:signal transduction histidine kinase
VLLGMIAITGRLRADSKERDLFERQQAFIARVTHELKTPLAGIRVMAETLEMGAAKDEETSKVFLEKIIQEAERLGKRIDEVLTVARKPEVSARTPVAPHELAQEMVDLWTPRYQAVGARLDTDLKACESIAADPALLRDALSNLLDNALKYRRVGIPGRCMVRTGEVGRFVIFEVTDNGIGVPVSMRRRIFERFARVEGAGRGKAGGHGLGLSFAAEAVEAHGGLIECLDGFNGGTRIRLKLRRG